MSTVATAQSAELTDLRVLFANLSAKRWWIALGVTITTAAFAAFAFLSTPIYRAQVVLMPATADRNNLSGSLNSALGQTGGALVSLLGGSVGTSDAATEEALAVLRSREFTQRFIEDGQLLPKLYPRLWDAETKRWRTTVKIPTLAKGFKYFDTGIRSIDQNKKTGLVMMQIDWRDRNEASDWANELVLQLNSEMRTRAIAYADASVSFLEKELSMTTVVETRDAINHLIEAQEKQRMIANVTHEFAFRVVDKALPPDADDPIRPRKKLLLALGLFLGFALSIGAVVVGAELARH